jgi:ribosomal protein S18 acetylase RimI-like enzyme
MSVEQIKITPYNEMFREQMISVWEASVRATHHFVKEEDIGHLKELVKGIDFYSFSVYCLVSGDRVLGFMGTAAETIEMLFLDPDFIGQGYGKRLMKFALEELKASKVDVNEQNTKAVEFYSGFGFVPYDRTDKSPEGKDYPILKMKLQEKMNYRTSDLQVRLLNKDELIPYSLLLLADETMEAIDNYIKDCKIYVLEGRDTIAGVYALQIITNDTIEIKNIAVDEKYQRQGLGKFLLRDVSTKARAGGFKTITVGTGDVLTNLVSFYQREGFEIFDVRENYFIDNYTKPIYDHGLQLKHMVMLKKELT